MGIDVGVVERALSKTAHKVLAAAGSQAIGRVPTGFPLISGFKNETRAISEATRKHDYRHWSNNLSDLRQEAWKKGESLPERGFWDRSVAAIGRWF